MFEWKASNAIFLDENTGGKGKYFRARILQAGLVKYSFGVCLLENEVINKFIYEFVGCPVIIDHKDITNENAKDERVGVISRVWFDQMDGWFWVEGVIFDEEAISLISDGYNVSCQYEISEYANNVGNQLHNGNPYDKVILNGKPEHLAIVKNPRYENAMIAVNALDATNEEFRTADDGHVYPLKRASEYGECYGRKAALVGELADIEKHCETLMAYGKNAEGSHSKANRLAVQVLLGKAKGIIERLDAMNKGDEKGRWITIKGTHVFIPDGKSVEDVMKERGFDKSSLVGEKKKSDIKFKTGSEYKSKKHPDGIVFDLIGEDDLIKGFEDASKGQTISKELEDKLSKEMQKYSNLPGWSDKFEQMWDEIDDYHDQWKEQSFSAERENDKQDKLKGKYAKEDADFDIEQLPKDIKSAQDLGYKSIEDIAEFLGLDEDEVRETIIDGKGNLKPEFGGDGNKDVSHIGKANFNNTRFTFNEDKENMGLARPIYKDLDKAKDLYEMKHAGQQRAEEENLKRSGKRGIPLRDQPVVVKGPTGGYIVATVGLAQKYNLTEVYPINRAKNSIIQAINEIKETDMFSKLFKKKENKMDKDELKSLFMECLSELTAKNEAEEDDKKEDKKAENEEDVKDDEDMKGDEDEAANKCKNDIVDKRDIIRQIMAIAGKHEDNEDVRTIAKLAEKLAYDKSEADKKADNKCKNEDEDKEEDDKKEKASNAIDEIIGQMSAGVNDYKPEPYLSKKKAIELGDKLF